MTQFPYPEKPTERKMASTVLDNGAVHWGAGMPGSICGVFDPTRNEVHDNRAKVTCKTCQHILRTRP